MEICQSNLFIPLSIYTIVVITKAYTANCTHVGHVKDKKNDDLV
jgi:hypothetical protein